MNKASENKFLIVGPNAIMTPTIEPIIVALDSFFAEANLKATVTSGLRIPNDQLRIIRDYLKIKKLDVKYPEAMSGNVTDRFNWQGQDVYRWQPGWSALLNAGVIINPAIKSICLLDYVNKMGVNKKGKFIDESIHFSGCAFDIGGGYDHDVSNELAVVNKAMPEIKAIISYVIERENNCLHLNCKKI